uniref:Uncharacterized protein n=1 Tax=Meloidogyne floridensis TaxID=298350 RepID=A0A915NZA9_9BILA
MNLAEKAAAVRDSIAGAASNAGQAVANAAAGAKDKVVAGAKVVGETAVNAGKVAGETVGGYINFLGINGKIIGFARNSTAATNVKDATVNLANAAGQKVKGTAEVVGEDISEAAKETGNVVGKGLENAGHALQSEDHPAEQAKEVKQ